MEGPGRFRCVGTAAFPGRSELKCDLFEWNFDGLKIRFLSPNGRQTRVFHVEPVLSRLLQGKSNRYLEQACKKGFKALKILEPTIVEEQKDYKVWQAIFRNRNAGQVGIRRHFNSVLDFSNFGTREEPEIICYGLGAGETTLTSKDQTILQRATKLLSETIRTTQRSSATQSSFSLIVEAYKNIIDKAFSDVPRKPTGNVPIHHWPGRSSVDYLFTDGWARSTAWDPDKALEKIRLSLIFGPVSKKDFGTALENKPFLNCFVNGLQKAACSKSAREFDGWLAKQREHGYLSLVGASSLQGDERRDAISGTKRIFCLILWLAYERMARCYGALMLLVYIDFCLHNDQEPTVVEKWLFRQQHFPQLFLGGIPLDFFERPQLRWIVTWLYEMWNKPTVEIETYDRITEMLGIFGLLVRARRDGDRLRKRGRIKHTITKCDWANVAAQPTADTTDLSFESREPANWLSAKECQTCRTRLRLLEIRQSQDPTTLYVTVDCPHCDIEQEFVANYESLKNLMEKVAES